MLRHSASSWADASSRDADRALTPEGRALARKVAEEVMGLGWMPDFTLCSNSVRSKETLEMMRAVDVRFGEESKTIYLGSLYHFASLDGQLRQHLSECVVKEYETSKGNDGDSRGERGDGDGASNGDEEEGVEMTCESGTISDTARTIMCVGHNKGMEQAASEFCGRDVQLQVATAALLEKTYDGEDAWSGVMNEVDGKGSWTLVAIASPDGVIRL